MELKAIDGVEAKPVISREGEMMIAKCLAREWLPAERRKEA